MLTPISQHTPAAAHLTPGQLAHNPTLTEQEKVSEMSRQFEAVLLRQILAEAHKPVFKSSMSLGSSASAVHQDLLVNELANQITRAGGTGLAQQLAKDLNHQVKGPDTATAACEAHAEFITRWNRSPEPAGSTSSSRWIR